MAKAGTNDLALRPTVEAAHQNQPSVRMSGPKDRRLDGIFLGRMASNGDRPKDQAVNNCSLR
jgi:hypothetical protein